MRISGVWRERFPEALTPGEAGALLPFLEAVTEQVVYRLEPPPPEAALAIEAERDTALQALAVLRASISGDAGAEAWAAAVLAARPALLTAFFANMDLLEHGTPFAHGAALALHHALARAGEPHGGWLPDDGAPGGARSN